MNLSERALIEEIKKRVGASSNRPFIGIGDDCSVFGNAASGAWLVSTDMLVDGIHFNRTWHSAKLLGRKSIAVNLSDIAAMGGIPRYVLIAMSLPVGLSSDWLFQWLDGVCEIIQEYDCSLIGGDTVSGREMTISVTVLGEQHSAGVLLRSGARAGDTVYVSAPLGSAAAGLAILSQLESESNQAQTKWQTLIDAHLDPVPRIRLGQILCASGYVSAMQDISDGLATDLSHICRESGVGAMIEERHLPSHPDLASACQGFGLSRLDCILRGGEDYQLVFTVKKDCDKKFADYVSQFGITDLVAIGTIESGQGVILIETNGSRREITFQGYEHRM